MNQDLSMNQRQPNSKFQQFKLQQTHSTNHLSIKMMFNYNSSILFQINRKYISAYFFQLGCLKLIKNFLQDTSMQRKIYYMEKSNQLVLFTVHGYIKVSSIVGLNNNKHNLKLNTLVFIDSLTMNKEESIIIIGSQGQIDFWENVSCWRCIQTLICHNVAPIYCLCLNQSETLLISCAFDRSINISAKQGQQWIVKQIINLDIHGFSLLFIDDNCFVFQSIELKILVYQWKGEEDIFVQVKDIIIQGKEHHLDSSKFQYNADKDIILKKMDNFSIQLVVLKRLNYQVNLHLIFKLTEYPSHLVKLPITQQSLTPKNINLLHIYISNFEIQLLVIIYYTNLTYTESILQYKNQNSINCIHIHVLKFQTNLNKRIENK
ncbi:unnamed protein product [Paramecium octaurelia]|uniref:Uncharacterized protein n=1 Tax=Paramecium octaurelia TaxID=43137 RepID=A0A8S1UDY1_PAROT|nr:unnamed protein product [Paramecium octaurelia]